MNHSFNTDIAKEYGIKEAVIVENLGFWLKKNLSNKKNIHDGYVWSYNSIEALHELFPYLSTKQIRYALEKLEKANVIKSANYNKAKYDRTKWYTIYDEHILQLYKIHLPILSNAKDQVGQPIPDINTDIKPEREETLAQDRDLPKQPETPKDRPEHAKDKYSAGYNKDDLRPYAYMKQQKRLRYEQFYNEFGKHISNPNDFLQSFNDKYDYEGKAYDPDTIYYRLKSFARNWQKNENK